ncbi:hypothetical protein [Nocardioides convexus]|uniref:hypothetical protein n=1 Tax=Nocardioides convexus TaxID=2712224 RepID=UPI0024187F97|nr:hypothetical protein [Nocardioides convexus]
MPATLGLAERSSIIQTDKGPQTSRFVVPFLDLHVTKQRLVEIVGGPGGAPAIGGGAAAAIGQQHAALPAGEQREDEDGQEDLYAPYADRMAECTDLDALQAVWTDMVAARLVGTQAPSNPQADPAKVAEITAAFKARADQIKASGQQAAPPTTDEPVEAEIVPEEPTHTADPGADPDTVWQQIVTEAGRQGMTLADVQDHFAQVMQGLTADSASAAELQHYLAQAPDGTRGMKIIKAHRGEREAAQGRRDHPRRHHAGHLRPQRPGQDLRARRDLARPRRRHRRPYDAPPDPRRGGPGRPSPSTSATSPSPGSGRPGRTPR